MLFFLQISPRYNWKIDSKLGYVQFAARHRLKEKKKRDDNDVVYVYVMLLCIFLMWLTLRSGVCQNLSGCSGSNVEKHNGVNNIVMQQDRFFKGKIRHLKDPW